MRRQRDTAQSNTAYDRIAAEIRAKILSGELSPGDRLPTGSELTAQYQVSHNTAREALLVLASEGLLTLKRGVTGGTFVSIPSTEHVTDVLQTSLTLLSESAHLPISSLLEIRDMLEVPAAEMAALRHTDEDIAAIRQSLFDPARPPTAIYTQTREFHATVVKAAHNPLLELIAEPVFGVLRERFLRDRAPRQWWQDVDRDHREILGYVQTRDQAGAREATRAHLRSIRRLYEAIDREQRD